MFWAISTGILFAFITSLTILFTIRTRGPTPSITPEAPFEISFLLRDGIVVDATPQAAEFIEAEQTDDVSWDDLRQALLPLFPAFPLAIVEGQTTLCSDRVPGLELLMNKHRQTERISVEGLQNNSAQILQFAVIQQDHEMLCRVAGTSPNPSWASDKDGTVIWHNKAFMALTERVHGGEQNRPCPFDLLQPQGPAMQNARQELIDQDGARLWYEVTSYPTIDGWMHFAVRIDSLVQAELAQRNFVQTLTKTFAHLPIGLAVFDREHQLVLFNPALVDLTQMPVDFLSGRPTLASFFDNMRDNHVMPEPKNYSTWRSGLSDVIAAAREDRYCETWNLPTGLTYKITGRPHPDGAIAFLLEDISAEVSLTRRFRSELDLTQSVIDCLAESVAVFSRLGVLTLANATFRDTWCPPASDREVETSILDTTAAWQTYFGPNEIWGELQEFILTTHDRHPREYQLAATNGEMFTLIAEPVSNGATLLRFRQHDTANAQLSEQKRALG
jgi:PAS domain-containing protein